LVSLAYAELYLTTAALVRHFDFELADSSIKNITMYRDYALSFDEDYNYGVKSRSTRCYTRDDLWSESEFRPHTAFYTLDSTNEKMIDGVLELSTQCRMLRKHS
jgi:hypothetical protein